MLNKFRKLKYQTSLVIFGFIFSRKVSAQGGLVPCDGVNTPCTFDSVIELVDRIIDFVFVMIMPIAAIMFAYAGFLWLTSAGDTTKIGKAKGIFVNVAKGIIAVAAAWFIISTIMVSLGAGDYSLLNLAQMN